MGDCTEIKYGTGVIVKEGFSYDKETHFTVFKTSLFFPGDGFAVYDSDGRVVFRVDSYGEESRDTGLVLMDPSGRCLLTVRRKRPSLHQRWEGFIGEKTEGQKPIFSVRRSSIIGRSNITVEYFFSDRMEEYHIEGCFGNRSCTIYNSGNQVMAEIQRKVDASSQVVLDKDVFSLTLKPGFDGAFAMGLVLVLDQINGDDDGDCDGADSVAVGPDPTAQDSNFSS